MFREKTSYSKESLSRPSVPNWRKEGLLHPCVMCLVNSVTFPSALGLLVCNPLSPRTENGGAPPSSLEFRSRRRKGRSNKRLNPRTKKQGRQREYKSSRRLLQPYPIPLSGLLCWTALTHVSSATTPRGIRLCDTRPTDLTAPTLPDTPSSGPARPAGPVRGRGCATT